MELEAAPRQSIERAAAAPVERQKATRLARGRTGDGVTLYDGRPRAASACEVGDRGANRATAADHDARARAHSSYCVRRSFPVPVQLGLRPRLRAGLDPPPADPPRRRHQPGEAPPVCPRPAEGLSRMPPPPPRCPRPPWSRPNSSGSLRTLPSPCCRATARAFSEGAAD